MRVPQTRQKRGGAKSQGVGWGRAGLSSKLHLAVDSLGNPLRVRLTAGQVNDSTQAEALLEGWDCAYVLADCGYASQHLRDQIEQRGDEAE